MLSSIIYRENQALIQSAHGNDMKKRKKKKLGLQNVFCLKLAVQIAGSQIVK